MPQVRKDAVQRRIEDAALTVFAREGYPGATMARIAREAGVGTGNLYRYFEGKDALFREVLPDAFVAGVLDRIHRRIDALAGVDDLATLRADAPFHAATEDLVAFCAVHRREVLILLGRAQGSAHAGFADALVGDLAARAVAHFRARAPGLEVGETFAGTLDRLYRNWVAAMVDLLSRYPDPDRIRRAAAEFSRYHLAGLRALFAEGM